jgi:hypothetical protein
MLQTIRRLCWWSLAVWAVVFMTPLFIILRELVGPGRHVFEWAMWAAPFLLLGGGVALALLNRAGHQRLPQ